MELTEAGENSSPGTEKQADWLISVWGDSCIQAKLYTASAVVCLYQITHYAGQHLHSNIVSPATYIKNVDWTKQDPQLVTW